MTLELKSFRVDTSLSTFLCHSNLVLILNFLAFPKVNSNSDTGNNNYIMIRLQVTKLPFDFQCLVEKVSQTLSTFFHLPSFSFPENLCVCIDEYFNTSTRLFALFSAAKTLTGSLLISALNFS